MTGSPEISRTVVRPSRAASITSALRPAWSSGSPLASTATTISAVGPTWAWATATASESTTTRSAAAISAAARNVSRSGSPGPAATSDTLPWGGLRRALARDSVTTTGVTASTGADLRGARFAAGFVAVDLPFVDVRATDGFAGPDFFTSGLAAGLATDLAATDFFVVDLLLAVVMR